MIVDARSIGESEHLETDVCIIGGGPAGITIAEELASCCRLILMESGGEASRLCDEELNRGTVVGFPYYSLELCRSRNLGGSTRIWGGWARPLDTTDFEKRHWVPNSGWPLRKEDLIAEYRRAHEIWGLGEFDYGARRSGSHPSPPVGAGLEAISFRIRATRFGTECTSALRRSTSAHALVHATVTELWLDRANTSVHSVRAVVMGGNRFSVSARFFVLAAGAIENARLLLASDSQLSCGIGNQRGLVGRFFGDHLHTPIGLARLVEPCTLAFFEMQKVDAVGLRGGLALSEKVRRELGLLGCAITLHNPADPRDSLHIEARAGGYREIHAIRGSLRCGRLPDRPARRALRLIADAPRTLRRIGKALFPPAWKHAVIGCRSETAPDRENRVELSAEKDPLGSRRVRLHWRPSELDLRTIAEFQGILRTQFSCQFARELIWHAPGEPGWGDRVAAGAHHFGSTRMHSDPSQGVVDETCRVHGVSNLYVAGSSVFPTGGWTNPTLTILALTLRLSARLKVVLDG